MGTSDETSEILLGYGSKEATRQGYERWTHDRALN